MARRENSSDLLRRAARKLEGEPGDAHWSGPYRPGRPLRRGAVRKSLYLTMRDGVRIAVDLHLPADLRPGERLPAILRQTRYGRSVEARALWRPLRAERLFDLYARTRDLFLAHGYAWIDADVRGSGASFGRYRYPWTPEEIADGGEIADWIARAPWSSGAIGATGISYDGNAAEFLLANAHPAVRAVAPRACHFDTYADVAFPGGLHQKWFTEAWGLATALLDGDEFARAMAALFWLAVDGDLPVPPADRSPMAGALRRVGPERFRRAARPLVAALIRGVRPADGDRRALAEALADHRDAFDIHAAASAIAFRDDDAPGLPGVTMDAFSGHARAAELAASGAAVYAYSGWFDGGNARAAAKRFNSLRSPGGRLVLGPWEHLGALHVSPHARRGRSAFPHEEELLRFFDFHLRGETDALAGEPPVRYYTMGEERWKAADAWPPPRARRTPYYLGADRALAPEVGAAGEDAHRPDLAAGTGKRSRWETLLSMHAYIGYPDRRERDARLLCYDSAPLARDLEVTGHPVAFLYLVSDRTDGALFAYLEEVEAGGAVHYVTEGMLRALHRRVRDAPPPTWEAGPTRTFRRADAWPLTPGEPALLAFDLLPVSYRFRAGSRVRIALAGADADHFAVVPEEAPTLRVLRGRAHPSRIELPVIA